LDLEIEPWRIEIDVFAPRNAIHDLKKRRRLFSGHSVIVLYLDQGKGRPPPVRDEHWAVHGCAFGSRYVTREIAARDGVNGHDRLPES
jgi:hypothetical protein